MTDEEVRRTLDLIEKLQNARIGDPSRLSAIKSALEEGRTVYESDKQYLKQKHEDLQEKQDLTLKETNPKPQKKESSEDDNYSLLILKNRLAKGEISPEEYDRLKAKLLEENATTGVKDEIRHMADTMEKMQNKQMAAESMRSQMKSESVTLVLSILLGLFGLSGIGHMYAGKVGKGAGILILGLALVIIGVATVAFFVGYIFLIVYLVVFIWQIIDSKKICQKYNEYYRLHNEPPW